MELWDEYKENGSSTGKTLIPDMHFGMPTLIENTNLEEAAQLCHNLGLSFIELNMNFPQYQIQELEKTEKLKQLADKYGLYFTIHLDENLNVSDFNNAITEAYLNTVQRAIAVAKIIGTPIINMHMSNGVYITLPNKKVYLYDQYRDIYLESIKKFKDICEEEIGDSNIIISIENTDTFKEFHKDAMDILLDSKVFSLTWDIGHCHSYNNEDEDFLLQHEDKLKHFHIHDAIGSKNHLTLGAGEINLEERVNIAKRNHCRCVLETKTIAALRQSVEWLKKNKL